MGLFDKFKNIFTKDKTEQKEIEVYDKGLEKTRKELFSKLDELNKKHKKITEEYFEELEEILIMADIGVNTVDKIRKRVKKENIIDSKICTVCNCSQIHSYRGSKHHNGLEMGVLELKDRI